MPDLIIKPTATSGNKLILKDQAGGAVLTTADSGATAANVTLASTTTFPAGHVIKVYSATFDGTHSVGINDSYGNVGNGASGELNITCDTPHSQSSKYLIFASVCHSANNNGSLIFRLVDGSSNIISQGQAGGARIRSWMGRGHYSTDASIFNVENTSMNYLWSPDSASAQTIKVQASGNDASVFYINRSHDDRDANWQVRTTSSLTIMEVVA